jgi:AraC family transcriptional regulator of adaptative response / DNA-3-methyladenine glycosylase II
MRLDSDTCYRAMLARDPRFDGRFFTGVTSTGIYCRPICPARTPARQNMRFFPHAAAAEAAGFRACRRCRPEASPGSPDWNVRADLAARAIRLITDGYVDEHGVAGLARRLAITDRHLRRLLLAELGTTPLALARTTRLQTARRLLAETGMPVTEIAFASGYSSVRQFNASFQETYRQSPSALRSRTPRAISSGNGHRPGAGPQADGTWLSLRLACREPFDGQSLLRFLAARAIPGVEEVAGNRYTRTVHTPGGPGLVELLVPPSPAAGRGPAGQPGPGQVLLRTRLAGLRGVGQLVSRCRQLLDLDADPHAIADALGTDPVLAPLVAARPGLRVPGAYDGFELAVRAVLGQQVSVAAARTFAARIAARFGSRLALSGEPASGDGRPSLLFPGPADLAEADLSGLGLTGARQLTVRALAGAVASGQLSPGPGADPEETAARLAALPGIGPWTVSYVLMRAVADPDAFPAADLGLRRALAWLGCDPGRAGRWRPWRAYAALHLWAALPGVPATSAKPAAASRPAARELALSATTQE